jgi:tetratricopeptide (TPR) repeat protein
MIVAAAVTGIAVPALAATTVQQDFDAAQALLDAGKAAEARNAFTALLARLPPNGQTKAASLVRARLGSALLATDDPEAAERILTAAVAGLNGVTPQDAEERGIALYDLARAIERQGRLDSAAAGYRKVIDARLFEAGSADDLVLHAALARTLIWSNPAEARRLLDALLALPRDRFGKSGDNYAQAQTLRGRVDLNDGNAAEAKRWFTLAARTAGGAETTKVSVADVRIRGDLALANFKLGKMDEVQKNVAYSGAGSLVTEGLTLAANTPLPACAPLTSLAPDAVAVVEFAIDADGRVSGVAPIYASRGSGSATPGALDDGPEVLFPQAVRGWFWNPADVARLNRFWRQAVRVELRCFTARGGGDPVAHSFRANAGEWMSSRGVRPVADVPANDAAALPILRAELARREAADGADSIQLVPPLNQISGNGAATAAERKAAAARRTALLVAAKAPASVTGQSRLFDIEWDAARGRSRRERATIARDALLPLLAEQEATGDETRIAMAIRLRLAEAHDDLNALPASRALLDRIVGAPESLLPGGDPIRTAALIRLSNRAAAAKDAAAAAAALAATGLSPEQCSLVDVRPQAVNASIGSSAFPMESMRWRTGGFVKVGYDITAAGKPVNLRTIVASPPFTFGPATEKAVARFEYRPVFRPDNSVGCSGNVQGVTFRVAS